MGTLTYHDTQAQFDDRLLTHLQVVIVKKFSAGDSFLLSWSRAPVLGSGRVSVWMVPTVPATFRFAGSRVPAISRAWVHLLMEIASTGRGLVVLNEDGTVAQEGTTAPGAMPGVHAVRDLAAGDRGGMRHGGQARTSLADYDPSGSYG